VTSFYLVLYFEVNQIIFTFSFLLILFGAVAMVKSKAATNVEVSHA
jgi:hypothetical protein